MEILKRTDWWRLTQLVAAIAVSSFIGYRFQPMVANNANAVNTVVTIFSILAGFLIAVITFIAEPTLRQARKLIRQKLLFFLYLLTLGIALAMFLTPPTMLELLKWLQTAFLGLATFVFLASFSLPGSLMKIQMERYEAALEDSRPKVITDAKKAAEQAKKRNR